MGYVRQAEFKESESRLHRIYNGMKGRCRNSNDKDYRHYGGRGIDVCEEWINREYGFARFQAWALENGYQDDLTIDRIDNDKGYAPDNCRWTTQREQIINRRVKNQLGARGVERRNSRYRATIRVQGKHIYLGTYNTVEEASAAYKEAEQKYYGKRD